MATKLFLLIKKDKEEKIVRKFTTSQRYAALHAEVFRKDKVKEECRKIWHSEGRIPVVGGGWVDIRKIPYAFLKIHDDDNEECGVANISGKYYWTGKKIIPKHASFSGEYNLYGKENKKTYGGTYMQIYPPEGWKEFYVLIEFYNYQKIALCKALGENYYFTTGGYCQKKCLPDTNKCACINLGTRPNYKFHPSQIIQTAVHPDFDLMLNTEKDLFLYYKLRTWPFEESEPLPPLRLRIASGQELANWTNVQFSEFTPSSTNFSISPVDRIYFTHSKLHQYRGNIEMREAQNFFIDLREYILEIYIKD